MSARITELPGLEVHHRGELTGRLIVTQEAPTIDEEVDGLRRLQRLRSLRPSLPIQGAFGRVLAALDLFADSGIPVYAANRQGSP